MATTLSLITHYLFILSSKGHVLDLITTRCGQMGEVMMLTKSRKSRIHPSIGYCNNLMRHVRNAKPKA